MQLQQWLKDDSRDLKVVDVREPWELAVCQLPQAITIPMQQIPARINEFNSDDALAILCHHGIRSQHVGRFLESSGFSRIYNVSGGIDAWAKEIDRQMATY